MHLPDDVFQILIVLSYEPVATSFDESKSIAYTDPVCPENVYNYIPLYQSHRITMESSEPENKRFEVYPRASDLTACLCPTRSLI